jgi:hypothetical protein
MEFSPHKLLAQHATADCWRLCIHFFMLTIMLVVILNPFRKLGPPAPRRKQESPGSAAAEREPHATHASIEMR